tara:strand:+ start:275 stop:1075 length:801 start_codon:yes stop_codon:yes gene_type:complete
MTVSAPSLAEAAVDVLTTADPDQKVSKTYLHAAAWRNSEVSVGHCTPPDRPARPSAPRLCAPREMPKRSTGPKGRIALVHALAHIELNAVDLAWDIVARFTNDDMPDAFYDDWVMVAEEEAKHFEALNSQLDAWNTAYGDLPAHDGLWEAATTTADALLARLALIPMTLEARGIDTTPPLMQRLRQADDEKTANILDMIYKDEINHLAVGVRWFEFLCARDQKRPTDEYKNLMDRYFRGVPKGPFNIDARTIAGMTPNYLAPWLES